MADSPRARGSRALRIRGRARALRALARDVGRRYRRDLRRRGAGRASRGTQRRPRAGQPEDRSRRRPAAPRWRHGGRAHRGARRAGGFSPRARAEGADLGRRRLSRLVAARAAQTFRNELRRRQFRPGGDTTGVGRGHGAPGWADRRGALVGRIRRGWVALTHAACARRWGSGRSEPRGAHQPVGTRRGRRPMDDASDHRADRPVADSAVPGDRRRSRSRGRPRVGRGRRRARHRGLRRRHGR